MFAYATQKILCIAVLSHFRFRLYRTLNLKVSLPSQFGSCNLFLLFFFVWLYTHIFFDINKVASPVIVSFRGGNICCQNLFEFHTVLSFGVNDFFLVTNKTYVMMSSRPLLIFIEYFFVLVYFRTYFFVVTLYKKRKKVLPKITRNCHTKCCD